MTNTEKYRDICNTVRGIYPVLSSTWENAYERFGDEWLDEFIKNIEVVCGEICARHQNKLIDAIDGYAEFCNDSLRNQSFFEKNGHYKASSYAECCHDYYNNEEHMTRSYLPGMYLSHYLWPQHYNMLSGFRSNVLRRVSKAKSFFEVGVGCGMYSKVTLESFPNIKGIGFDISQYSLDFTKTMIDRYGLGDRYSVENHDISQGYSKRCDFLICQEVLEHLEDPGVFCKWLYNMIEPEGHAYITAALNAAHSDHIYLLRDPMELEELLRDAGFQPIGLQEEFAAGEKPRYTTPSLAGYLCKRL